MIKTFLSLLPSLLVALFITSCTIFQPKPEPPVRPSPEPPSPPPPQIEIRTREFPDFIAVIAQSGDTFSSLASKYLHDPSMDWLISEWNGTASLSPGQELIIPLRAYGKGGITTKHYQTVPVIVYHKFSKTKADLLTITESAFEEQMRFLKENGYRVITMDEFFDFLDFKRPLPPRSVVITIDDDYYSTYEIAFPILKKFGYPATFFIYTDLIYSGGKTLHWDLLAEMSRHGMDVQCHTKSHRNLDKRNGDESFQEYFEAVKKELLESSEMIKKRLNKEVKYLAYPYGTTNHLVIALLKKLGYRGAFTVERGSNPFFIHSYRINRSMIFGNFNIQDFQNCLDQWSDRDLR